MPYVLTRHGERLFWRHHPFDKREVNYNEFIREIVQGEIGPRGECLWCGDYRPLVSRVFCAACLRGAVKAA